MTVIEGERVNLRDLHTGDIADYQRWFEPGWEWQEWDAPWEPLKPLGDDVLQRWCERGTRPASEPRSRLEIETDDGRHIGWVNSYWADDWVDQDIRRRECGIVIAEDELWGQGLGREAFALWVGYLFVAYDLPRIGMGTWSGNKRMLRVAARVGMRSEACFRVARLVRGRRFDAVGWGLTRAEWERYQAPRMDGLRTYTPADWDATVELTRQLFQYHRDLQNAPEFRSQDAQETVYGWLSRRDNVLWVWQEEEKVVGLARARYDGVYFFEQFVVADGHRGQGVGTRFLQALEDHLRQAGEQDVFLSMVWPGNPGAIDFYRRHGYDLLNSFELRKGLERDRRGRAIKFLDRRFHLAASVPGTDIP